MCDIEQLLQKIRQEAETALANVKDNQTLENLRVQLLGKKGKLTEILRGMGNVSAEVRPILGKQVNELRVFIEERLDGIRGDIKAAETQRSLERDVIDITLPGKANALGKLHPFTTVLNEFVALFVSMGFTVASGPEIELDYYNFEALNIPKNHPSRDIQDTFYIDDNVILRTQTSPVQVRYMEKHKPPIKIIAPGRTYRDDSVDATHGAAFHQVEGLVVDEGITFGDLKGTLEVFCKKLYGEKTKARFRPHHFPFTEPSAEMDITCPACGGNNRSGSCRVCKGEGWVELLGSGMVHPKVLQCCGIDSERYSGFAFGIGIERMTLRKYGIDDLRLLFENDLRFLRQF